MQIEEIHQKFVEYGTHAKEWRRKCALLLPDIEKYEIWRRKGFQSIYEYAAKLAGLTRLQVDDAIRILRKIVDKPSLMAIAQQKGINAVRPVATIATKETDQYWAKKADTMSKNELETFVRDITAVNGQTKIFNKEIITMELNPEIATKLKQLNGSNWNDLMETFIILYEKDLVASKPPVKKTASRAIPAKIAQYVVKRCRNKCEFPDCDKPYKHLHHTNRFASDKTHDPNQIIALCEAHHNLAHKGLIKNENLPPRHWQIQMHPDMANFNRLIDEQVQFYRQRS